MNKIALLALGAIACAAVSCNNQGNETSGEAPVQTETVKAPSAEELAVRDSIYEAQALEQQREDLNTVVTNLMTETVRANNSDNSENADIVVLGYCSKHVASVFNRDDKFYDLSYNQFSPDYYPELYDYGMLSDCSVGISKYILAGDQLDENYLGDKIENWRIHDVKIEENGKGIALVRIKAEYYNATSRLVFKQEDGAWKLVDFYKFRDLENYVRDYEQKLRAAGIQY